MPRRATWVAAAFGVSSLMYPLVVFYGRDFVQPRVFVAAALLLIAMRAATLSSDAVRAWRTPLIFGAAAIFLSALLDTRLAVRAYPVALSLAAAIAFAWSLIRPPNLIERIALIEDPDLPPAGRRYCRGVAMVWTIWLVANAAIAAFLAVIGAERAWALWTGLIAYAVMGLLFIGEILLRPLVRRSRVLPR